MSARTAPGASLLERARAAEPAWTAERSARVFSRIERTRCARRAASVVVSSLLGVAVLALAVRALGSATAASPAMGPPVTWAMDGGGG